MRWRRAGGVVAGVAIGVVLLGVVLNWMVVREAGDTATAEVGVVTGKTRCPKADGSSRAATSFAHPPPRCIKSGTRYTAEVRTDAGPVTVALDQTRAPVAVNNFVVLARYHFYDGSPLEDVRGVVQTQARDPGYTIADERPPAGSYGAGVVALASSGPGTIGGQFFVVVDDSVNLAPIYPPLGRVTAGLEALGTATRIESVTIRAA